MIRLMSADTVLTREFGDRNTNHINTPMQMKVTYPAITISRLVIFLPNAEQSRANQEPKGNESSLAKLCVKQWVYQY